MSDTTTPVKQESTKQFFDSVSGQITSLTQEGGIELPKEYSVTNALKAAWLILSETKDKDGNSVLKTCSKESIVSALMKMVTQGMNPAKSQCYFISYGKTLNFQRSYQGSIALSKRVANVKTVNAQVIYKGDVYQTEINSETGAKKLIKHEQKFENRNDDAIIGAYCVVVFSDGTSQMEDMTMQEILKAWNQGTTNGASPAHKNFKGEMAKKSAVNRALKTLINSSTDSELMDDDSEKAGVKAEIDTKANTETMDFDDHEEVETKIEQKVTTAAETKKPEQTEKATGEPSFA